MKKFVSRIFLCSFLLTLTSCCEVLEKQTKAMSITAYALKDSAEFGRYDLVDKYADQLIRLATPPLPEERITINPLTE